MKKRIAIKLWHINILLLIGILIFQFVIPRYKSSLFFYIDYLFYPFQKIKTAFSHLFSFSLGDFIYVSLIIWLLYSIVYWIVTFFKKNKSKILRQGARTLNCILTVLFLFVFFWNPNYKRDKLSTQITSWQSVEMNIDAEKELNAFLLHQFQKMDSIEFSIKTKTEWNQQIKEIYSQKFGNRTPQLLSKPSLFSKWIQSMGIQGYYNPISSEAQVNFNIPIFLHPFVIAHELAHQMGIASEGDANFTAYYICVNNEDPYLQYSAYFNLYLYNLRKLRNADTMLANESKAQLPLFVKNDIDTLNAFNARRPYDLNKFTIPFYDFFLQFNGEQQGIQSYGGMTKYGYVYELIEKRKTHIAIRPFNN